MKTRSSIAFQGLLPFIALLTAWQLIGHMSSPTLPPPSKWLIAFKDLYESGVLVPAVDRTVGTFGISLIACVIVGIVLGVFLGSSQRAQRALGPLLEFLRTMPHVTAIPIVILLVGINIGTTIIVVVFASVWPIFLNTAAAMKSLPPVRMEMARSLSLSRLTVLRKVILPSLMPRIILGFRVATPICLVAVLVVDVISANGGAGTLLAYHQAIYDAPAVFAITVAVGALGLILNIAVARVERFVLRNRPEGTS